ncbi:MAG: hypothetical protein R3266_03180 [Gemmatimonadota bacterium]|nr:hypothetical protein [Gemmatimonadota bacterium]
MEELIATLERETEERCAVALEEARREAERIRRETDELLERRRADAAAEMQAERRAWESAKLAATRKETRGALLRAHRRALDRIFDRARALLPTTMEDSAYLDALPEELRRALSCVADAEIRLDCPPALAQPLESARETISGDGMVSCRLSVRPSADAPPGFVAVGEATGVRVDATLATRLEGLRPQLEPELLRRFEAETGGGP